MSIRDSAVAGAFYPEDRNALEALIDSYVGGEVIEVSAPKAAIVPHAGYIYSGPIAGRAYASLSRHVGEFDRIAIFGPAHRLYFRGMALSGSIAFNTPLGDSEIDAEAEGLLRELPFVEPNIRAHEKEHCLEVQVPFIQRILGNKLIVPVLVGEARPAEVEQAMEVLGNIPRTLLLVSSDLSHYLSYGRAQAVDGKTRQAIEELDEARISPEEACGARAICGLIRYSKVHDLKVTTLMVANSGDTAGTLDQVVGYGAFILNPAGAGFITT